MPNAVVSPWLSPRGPAVGTKTALCALARRYEAALTAEMTEGARALADLVETAAPKLLEPPGSGLRSPVNCDNPAGSAGCALKPPSHRCVVSHRWRPAPAALTDADRRRCPAPPAAMSSCPAVSNSRGSRASLAVRSSATGRRGPLTSTRRPRRHSPAWALRGCSVGARMFPSRDGFMGRSQDSARQANRPLATQATIMAWTSLCVSGLSGRVVARLDFPCTVRE